MNASKLSKLSIDQLKALKVAVEQEIASKTHETNQQVKVTKVKDGTFRFEFNGKTYEAQKQGVRGRFRIYRMDKGLRAGTLKRAEIIDREYLGGVNDIRSAIAFGRIK